MVRYFVRALIRLANPSIIGDGGGGRGSLLQPHGEPPPPRPLGASSHPTRANPLEAERVKLLSHSHSFGVPVSATAARIGENRDENGGGDGSFFPLVRRRPDFLGSASSIRRGPPLDRSL